jgi:hypothetical protein
LNSGNLKRSSGLLAKHVDCDPVVRVMSRGIANKAQR